MLIYNVTTHVEFKIEKEWLLWMKQKHLSEILATKKFSEAKIFKIISEQDQGGASYAVQYHCKNKDLLNDFFKDYANYFQKKVEEKFGKSILFFKTELQLIEAQS
tara:strand:- start:446 stop:760 length:315 start_codon:yes stop_codon:yes gene_type:complete